MQARKPSGEAPTAGRLWATLALLAAVLLWGSTFIITKIVLDEVGPFVLTFLRFVIGLAVLAPLAYRRGFRWKLVFQPAFLWYGLTGIALFYSLQNVGLVFTSAGSASLIESSIPAVTAIASYLFLRERLSTPRVAGVALTILGVILVSGIRVEGSAPQALLGNLLVFGAVLSFAIYTVQGKKLLIERPPVVTTAASFGAGLLFLFPLAVGELWLAGPPQLSLGGAMTVLYLGCGTSALTLFLWNYALQFVDASAAALYTSLVPPVGLGFAVLLGESATSVQLVGGALAMLGVWIGDGAVRFGKAPPRSAARPAPGD